MDQLLCAWYQTLWCCIMQCISLLNHARFLRKSRSRKISWWSVWQNVINFCAEVHMPFNSAHGPLQYEVHAGHYDTSVSQRPVCTCCEVHLLKTKAYKHIWQRGNPNYNIPVWSWFLKSWTFNVTNALIYWYRRFRNADKGVLYLIVLW